MRSMLAKKKTQKASGEAENAFTPILGRGQGSRVAASWVEKVAALTNFNLTKIGWHTLQQLQCTRFLFSSYFVCVCECVRTAEIFMQMHLKHFKSVSAVQFA